MNEPQNQFQQTPLQRLVQQRLVEVGRGLELYDEAFAARAVASGMVFGGCGRQFQLVAGKAVACTGK